MIRLLKQTFAALSCCVILAVGNAIAQQTAQSARPSTRVPVLVAITNTPNLSQQPFMVLRRAGGAAGDVIVLREGTASAAQLSQAVYMLLASRRTEGDTAQTVKAFGGEVRTAEGQPARELPWAQRVIDDVRNAQPRAVPGVGRARAVQIWLPAQRGR